MYFFPVNSEDTIRAAFNAPPAQHTLVMVNADLIPERDTPDTHTRNLPIVGSPAFGMEISSTSGSIVRMAASSLDI